MKIRELLASTFTRIGIVIFWLVALGAFLWTPAFIRMFHRERSLTIFTWPSILDPIYLRQFEKETGIKLYISYYESNQELLSKVKATGGKGYDIIMPSDYALEKFVNDGLLQKIDRTKLSFFDQLNPHLMGNYFDPNGDYSLPFLWGVYGLGVNKNFFNGQLPEPTWGLIFDKNKVPAHIGMTDESQEAVLLAAYYLFGTIDNIAQDPEKIARIKELLIEQKQWVEAYTETRSEYLLVSETTPLVVALSPDIYKVKQDHPYLDFIMPREGSFIFIDAIVIPASTEKNDLIYEFLNFLYRKDVLDHHRKKFGFCSPLEEHDLKDDNYFCPTPDQFKKLDFFRNVVPQPVVNDIWITVMSR